MFKIENGVLIKYEEEAGVTEVVIPEGVKSIGVWAFEHCSSLTTVTIPDSVTSVGNSAFFNCSSLTTVTIPDSVTSIGDYAFFNCSSLTTVTIPDSVTSIGIWAFGACKNLTTVTIPDSVTSIESWAFDGCENLKLNIFGYSVDGMQCDIGGSNWSDIRSALKNKDYNLIKDKYVKFQIVAQVFLKDKQPEAEVCIKKNITKIMKYFIDIDDYETVKGLLESGKFVTKKNIMKFIDHAIEHTQNGGDLQIQVLLMNYKNDNFPYIDSFAEELVLK